MTQRAIRSQVSRLRKRAAKLGAESAELVDKIREIDSSQSSLSSFLRCLQSKCRHSKKSLRKGEKMTQRAIRSQVSRLRKRSAKLDAELVDKETEIDLSKRSLRERLRYLQSKCRHSKKSLRKGLFVNGNGIREYSCSNCSHDRLSASGVPLPGGGSGI